MFRDEGVLRSNDGKIVLVLRTHFASITELSSDVLSLGSYGTWACQFFEVDQTLDSILHLLVLYI